MGERCKWKEERKGAKNSAGRSIYLVRHEGRGGRKNNNATTSKNNAFGEKG